MREQRKVTLGLVVALMVAASAIVVRGWRLRRDAFGRDVGALSDPLSAHRPRSATSGAPPTESNPRLHVRAPKLHDQ